MKTFGTTRLSWKNRRRCIVAAYAYDPLGRRTKKTGTGIATAYYFNDGDDEVVEYHGSKAVVALYVPGPAIDEPIAISR